MNKIESVSDNLKLIRNGIWYPCSSCTRYDHCKNKGCLILKAKIASIIPKGAER